MDKHTVPPAPNPDSLASMVETFKALAEPTRARLVLFLVGGERSVNDLVHALGVHQSTVSRHLAVLRAADLVTTRREGARIHYRLASSHVGDLAVQAYSHAEHERLELPDHPGPEANEAYQRPAVVESRH